MMQPPSDDASLEDVRSWLRGVEAETKGLVAKLHPEKDNEPMSEPITRPELDAKLKTVELTLDRRIDGIEAKLDGLRGDVASTKSTVLWVTALIVGTIVATAALVVTSFDSGRDTAMMAADAQAQTNAALAEIRQIVNDLKAPSVTPPGQ